MAMAPLRASMDICAEAGIDRLREKSISLTGYLEFLLLREKSAKFSIVTPSEKERRGAQLSIRISDRGRALCEKLAAQGIFGDWREPDTFRIAPIPLYNTYQDAYRFVQGFCAALR